MLSSRGKALTVWATIFTVLTLLSMVLRFTAIRKQRRSLRLDDYLVIFSMVNMLVLEGCAFWAIHNGLGFHTTELTIPQLSVQFKLEFVGNFTWTLSTVSCKIAVLNLYLVIFQGPTFKKAVWAVMAASVIYGVVLIPIFVAACNPVWASWDPLLHEKKCWPWMYHSLAALTSNVILDVTIVAMPLPVVWSIQMPRRKKLGVSGMFSLGLSIVAIMIWRLITTVQGLSKTPDFSYDLYIVALQALLELWLGIIATNFPTIAPLFPVLIPPRIKQYFISKGSSRKGIPPVSIRTFGSSGQNPRRQDFNLLTNDDSNGHELGSVGHIGDGIERRREINVSVAAASKSDFQVATPSQLV